MPKESTYLYAVVRAGVGAPEVEGLEGARPVVIEAGGLGVLASPISCGAVRPRRANLAAHQRVVAAAAKGTALPLAFGMIVRSIEEARGMLETHGEALAGELERIDGCVEMGVRVRVDGADPVSFLVEQDTRLRSMRDELVAAGADAPHHLRVAVGEAFAKRLEQERDGAYTGLVSAVNDAAHEVTENAPKADAELANAAFLVSRDELGAFEAAVHAFAASLSDEYAIDLTGPWAPHHFVDLHLEVEPAAA